MIEHVFLCCRGHVFDLKCRCYTLCYGWRRRTDICRFIYFYFFWNL